MAEFNGRRDEEVLDMGRKIVSELIAWNIFALPKVRAREFLKINSEALICEVADIAKTYYKILEKQNS